MDKIFFGHFVTTARPATIAKCLARVFPGLHRLAVFRSGDETASRYGCGLSFQSAGTAAEALERLHRIPAPSRLFEARPWVRRRLSPARRRERIDPDERRGRSTLADVFWITPNAEVDAPSSNACLELLVMFAAVTRLPDRGAGTEPGATLSHTGLPPVS